jgi:hypothetical protein
LIVLIYSKQVNQSPVVQHQCYDMTLVLKFPYSVIINSAEVQLRRSTMKDLKTTIQ